jgi:hypothetical protein
MGERAEDVLSSFSLSEDEANKYETVVARLESHFIKKRNIIYERARFNQRCQEEGETVENFVTSLYRLAEHCQFGRLHDELIRDRIVVGLCDQQLSEKLQLDQELTLERAVNLARQSETVKQQQKFLRSNAEATTSGNEIGAVSRERKPATRPPQRSMSRDSTWKETFQRRGL